MPVLVDGNNLLFAARGLDDPSRPPGRAQLVHFLGVWAERRKERVEIVFDGRKPADGFAEQIDKGVVSVRYAGQFTADAVIFEIIDASTAARRMTVVSSDREVQRAARRRGATAVESAEFWAALRNDLAQADQPRAPREPREKRSGLTEGDTDAWMREFGLSDADDEQDPLKGDIRRP